jgi:hypothetical protein
MRRCQGCNADDVCAVTNASALHALSRSGRPFCACQAATEGEYTPPTLATVTRLASVVRAASSARPGRMRPYRHSVCLTAWPRRPSATLCDGAPGKGPHPHQAAIRAATERRRLRGWDSGPRAWARRGGAGVGSVGRPRQFQSHPRGACRAVPCRARVRVPCAWACVRACVYLSLWGVHGFSLPCTTHCACNARTGSVEHAGRRDAPSVPYLRQRRASRRVPHCLARSLRAKADDAGVVAVANAVAGVAWAVEAGGRAHSWIAEYQAH